MELNQTLEMVGGITRVVIHPATAPLPEVGGESGALVVSIEPGSAEYREVVTPSQGSYSVEHILQYSTQCHNSQMDSLAEAIDQGVVADITFGSGAVVRVGWSERYQLQAPLRLVTRSFSTGSQPADYPLQVWVWSATDNLITIGEF